MMILTAGLAFYLGWAGALRQGSFLGPGLPSAAPAGTASAPVSDGSQSGLQTGLVPPDEEGGPVSQEPPGEAAGSSGPEAPDSSEPRAGTESSPDVDAQAEPVLESGASVPVGGAGDRPTSPPPRRQGRFAIVIDDCGQDLEREREFMGLDPSLTLAVLPHVPDSQDVAREAMARGMCILLHLPMQAGGASDPGPGALLSDLPDPELARRARAAFDSVPGVVGFNNHEGSLATTQPRLVRAALQEAAARGLFVLDSRTSAASLLAEEAARQGLSVRSRDVFLDHEEDEAQVLAQLDRLASLALQRGSAVALGHPRPATLEALRRGLPRLREAGLELVPLAALMAGG